MDICKPERTAYPHQAPVNPHNAFLLIELFVLKYFAKLHGSCDF
jgi:hypothetical protein